MRIAGAALNQTPLDWDNNTSNIIAAINEAKNNRVDILCLPELCITGYGCEDWFLSEWVTETALQQLIRLLPHTAGITVSIGLPIRLNNQVYNCACLVRNQEILGISAKQFLANDGVHYETRWFTPWQHSQVVSFTIEGKEFAFGDILYEVEGVKIGFEICEDAWMPDPIRPASRLCKKKADLILNPSASHFAFGKSDFRYNLIIGSSERFNCTYLYSNLLGNEAGRMIFDGEVLIARKGKLIQRNNRLSFKNINLVHADIDFATGKISSDPLQPDEREKNFEFWEAVTLGLYDYMRKSHSKGFVLSLSGGADSSACAVMVSEMVKKGIEELGVSAFLSKGGLHPIEGIEAKPYEQQVRIVTEKLLTCAYQSTRNSGKETFDSAEKLAESIGAKFYSWDVEEQVSGYTQTIEQVLGHPLTWEQHDITLQNIQARSRAPIIWMLANINNALLITTSNRSEGDVGYATMDGDTAGSIAPIAGVDKHFIQQWLIWAEKNLNQPGLRYVNSLIPTAELRPAERTQTDEKDLMPYWLLAEIEKLAIQDKKSPVEVFTQLVKENKGEPQQLKLYVEKFFKMWSRNQWKRERLAPGFHLDTFNVDPKTWCRFPILNSGFKYELKNLEEQE
jgi:NAD+ synthase (glutamine-hydrolysing)